MSSAEAAEPPKLVKGILKAEGGVDAQGNAKKNPKSTALGAGQFVENTWLDQYKKAHPGTTLTDEEILDKRRDPKLSERMATQYVTETKNYLRKASIPATDGNASLAYFLGPYGTKRLLGADRDAPAQDHISEHALKANPHLKRMTVQQVIEWAHNRIKDK